MFKVNSKLLLSHELCEQSHNIFKQNWQIFHSPLVFYCFDSRLKVDDSAVCQSNFFLSTLKSLRKLVKFWAYNN